MSGRRERMRGTEKHARVCMCEYLCVRSVYLKELRWWNRTIGFLAPCNHVLREKRLVEEEWGGADRQTENISHCDDNYRVGICDRKRIVTQISLLQSAVIIFQKDTKHREF